MSVPRPSVLAAPPVARAFTALGILSLIAALPACDAFNPAFIDFVGSNFDAISVQPRGPDSAGHVVIAFRNDTVFDERMLAHLEGRCLEIQETTPAQVDQCQARFQGEALRPRIRILLQITFVNGEQLFVEFSDGSSTVIDPIESAEDFPDLIRGQQDNIVVQCDVRRVELVGLPSVFVPIFFETTRVETGDLNTAPFRIQVDRVPPQFVVLRVDDVDARGNTVVLRNFGVRDLPPPAIEPNCGSVVTITLSGTLRVPFEINETGLEAPGALDTDAAAVAASPGRFRTIVGIR